MIGIIKAAVDALDWRYVTLSQRLYDNLQVCTRLGDPHWLERPFAYEIYHQLRRIWTTTQSIIHAEVLKTYQGIQDIAKMPDLLIHDPESERNLAVVEIKLLPNTRESLRIDLDKLSLFRRVLRYETLVEILIGSDVDLGTSKRYLSDLRFDCDIPIHILTISLNDHRTSIFRVNDCSDQPRIAADSVD